MAFSCKPKLSWYEKENDVQQLYLEAIIDGDPARVPFGFYLHKKDLNKKGFVVSTHPNAEDYNKEIQMMIAKANKIASQYRLKEIPLTPELFRNEFVNPSDEIDFIKFMWKVLEERNDLTASSRKHHKSVITILEEFQKTIRFKSINYELLKKLKAWLIKKGNSDRTLSKKLKFFKQNLNEARRQGHDFPDPFKNVRIRNFRNKKNGLSESELLTMERYYDKPGIPEQHRNVLQYFLFSCHTGCRISDIKALTWDNIKDNGSMLQYIPIKTKRKNEIVSVPIMKIEQKFLPPFTSTTKPIFTTYSEQVINRYLKDIAQAIDLRKRITYHTSRHTFGTLMAEGGHLPETQIMMGHEDIKTTMEYVHVSTQALVRAKRKRFGN